MKSLKSQKNLKSISACVSLLGLTSTLFSVLIPESRAALEPMLDESALNSSVDPCTDFYTFSCGGWLTRTQLPGDQATWTRSFSTIDQENLVELRKILEGYAAHDFTLQSQYAEKLGDLYSACMNTDSIERTHLNALAAQLTLIEGMKKEGLSHVIGELFLRGYAVLFGVDSSPDAKNSSQMIAEVDQGGMGLPNRDYYFDESKASIRAQYVTHVARMLELSGLKKGEAVKAAQSILAFETELARTALSPVERRDPQKLYHFVPKSELAQLVPSLNWDEIFGKIGAPEFSHLNIAVPDFFRGLNVLLMNTPVDQLQLYFRWTIVHSMARNMGRNFVEENFNFYGKILTGQKEIKPRWKYCVQNADSTLGDALGEAFVKKTFGEEGKNKVLSILLSIKKAFRENLASISWMDQATRDYAIKKLDAIQNKMGYPEKWTDFSRLSIDRNSHLDNVLKGVQFWTLKEMQKVGRPVDRTEWGMTPSTVNAYYEPQKNEIVFPAGILQSPFFNRNSSLAANYGGIGMVIGHELTHGFDDQGRQFDEVGNLKEWWTPGIDRIFDEKAQCLVNQYSSYTVAGGTPINGKLTLGENLADLGGLKLAYNAYRTAAALAADKSKSGEPQTASRFTGEQQFFVSFAQGWCTQKTDELEKLRAATDPHSPPRYRVNGVVANLPEFQTAFGCQTGAPLAPAQRCSIW